MSAAPQSPGAVGEWTATTVPARRLVAVAVTDVDLLEVGSDLRHVAGAASEVDVLIVRHDPVGPGGGDSPMEAEDYPDDEPDGPPAAEVAVPAGLRLHHLGLRRTVQERDEPDLVAAMSELVGFDPDDHVFCVAPATGPEPVTDPELAVLRRSITRVARVYGLPVLHYRRSLAGVAPVVGIPTPEPPLACGS